MRQFFVNAYKYLGCLLVKFSVTHKKCFVKYAHAWSNMFK